MSTAPDHDYSMPHDKRHYGGESCPPNCPYGIWYRNQDVIPITGWPPARDAAYDFMTKCGLIPTPDAIGQLAEAFLPCLRIMCERPWDPQGNTWRKSGVLGILTDVRKKFERLWERGWTHGKRHDDSGYDLINYVGFYMRSPDNRWGEWGDPG